MKSFKPFIFNAVYEWIAESGNTPYAQVDVTMDGVSVPPGYAHDGIIVLNMGQHAIGELIVTEDTVSFKGAFGGKRVPVTFPLSALERLYAKETGEGMHLMMRPEEFVSDVDMWAIQQSLVELKPEPTPKAKPALRVVK